MKFLYVHRRLLTAGHRAAKPHPSRADKRGDWFFTGAGVLGQLTWQHWAQPEAVNFSAFGVVVSWPWRGPDQHPEQVGQYKVVLEVDGRALVLLPAMSPFPLFSLT